MRKVDCSESDSMSLDLKTLLRARAINGWNLFFLVSVPMCVIMIVALLRSDMTTGSGVSSMIGFSVRWAVPLIYLVVAASSVHILFPGPLSMWWLRNRKYFGLCFAVAMSWQGLFIFILSNTFRDFYFEDVYVLRDELEGSVGYIFLSAMVLTSFQFGRKYIDSTQWKMLHTSGIYFLWAYPFSVYWWNLSYYGNPQLIDYIFYWGGFLAFASRIAAWGKKRLQSDNREAAAIEAPLVFRVIGAGIIAFGILVAASGLRWQESVTTFLTAQKWSADLELWLPFWPFEPFVSLLIIGLGTSVYTTRRTEQSAATAKLHNGVDSP